jgi:hypothetical protein
VRSVAWLALALLVAGCSDPPAKEPLPEEWRGRDLREPGWENETVPPGWTLAMEYDWPSGKRVEWDWIAIEPIFVHFQLVRFEANGQARALVAHDAQQGEGQRTLAQGGRHQVDWMNEYSEPVTIWHHVPSGGTRILYPPGQGPGCLFQTGAAAPASAAPTVPTSCLVQPLPPP